METAQPKACVSELIADFAMSLMQLQASPLVYPLYIASRIKKVLLAADSENLLREMGEIQTIGDCVHAITVTDFNGTKYRITVEVEK